MLNEHSQSVDTYVFICINYTTTVYKSMNKHTHTHTHTNKHTHTHTHTHQNFKKSCRNKLDRLLIIYIN